MSYELMRVTDNEYININSIDDIADFGKLSEPLFKLVRTIEPNESGLIILPNDIISLFRCLFIGIEDYIDLIIAEFYAPLIERSKELTVSKEGQAEFRGILDESSKFTQSINKICRSYADVVTNKFNSENCFISRDLLSCYDIYDNSYPIIRTPYKVSRYTSQLHALEKTLLVPLDIKKSFVNFMVLNSHVSSWRPLIDCEDIKSLTSCNYTVNRKICKKLGLSYNIVNEYLKDLVDLINDDNCPKEVFDVFSSVFINYVPDLLSKNRGIFNKCKGDDYRFEKAIEKYNNYKKSGCYIEVVE